ncbi:MAG: sigma-70 family RNA polymerase sigma factor [Planctomycetota bacterium]
MDSQSQQDDTEWLVRRAREGDDEAREKLFGMYREPVRRAVRLRLGNMLRRRVEVNDVVQSVLLAAVRDLGQFEYRGEGAFLHWLNRIVENRVRDKLKREMCGKRDVRREQSVGGEFGATTGVDPTAHLPTPSRILSNREDIERIEAAIDCLPPDMKEVIILRKYENLPWKDVAGELGQTEAAVRHLFARALSSLSRIVKEMEGQDSG